MYRMVVHTANWIVANLVPGLLLLSGNEASNVAALLLGYVSKYLAHAAQIERAIQKGGSGTTKLSVGKDQGRMAAEIALDEEFKRVISEMKPHARLLPRQSGGVRCYPN